MSQNTKHTYHAKIFYVVFYNTVDPARIVFPETDFSN